jgi:hypothetical protein
MHVPPEPILRAHVLATHVGVRAVYRTTAQ